MKSLRALTYQLLHEYWATLIAGILSTAAFVWLGHTPIVRALGLSLAVAGVTLTLQRFGGALAIIGGLALAFSPAFWSQTGGGEQPLLTLILVILVLAAGATGLLLLFSKRPTLGVSAGVVIFVVLFWGLTGTPRSLRLTTLLTAWSFYLLIDGLMIARPRPDAAEQRELEPYHTFGILLLITLGVLNDPLFILMFPAAVLSLLLLQVRLPAWYWLVLFIAVIIGVRGMILQYVDSDWWLYPAQQAIEQNLRQPFLIAGGWREGARWLYLIDILLKQFTPAGLVLGVLGLARLSRWYPPVGEVTMLAYACYALFGLAYFGADSSVLLLPLLMIQVIWMTYAVYAFGQWMQKSVRPAWNGLRWLAPAAFMVIPLLMLLRIVGG